MSPLPPSAPVYCRWEEGRGCIGGKHFSLSSGFASIAVTLRQMFLEDPEGFLIEPFTSATRQGITHPLKSFPCMLGGGRERARRSSFGENLSAAEAGRPGGWVAAIKGLITEEASGPLGGSQPSGRDAFALKTTCSPLTANGCDGSCI